MGTVFRATDLELRREVAVKILSTTSATSDGRERLVREARAAAALNHPHIVTIHDVGEASGFPFLVMELVQGPRLSQARPTDLARVVAIAVQICDALEHAHSNNIIHRDLKPDNVLFSSTGDSAGVKLADLGLALPVLDARISRAGIIVGTASYMAPEQAMGQTIDGRTDLYALGVLLYELTTGRLPFTGDDPLTIVSQHVHAPVVPPNVLRPDLPLSLNRPRQRYSSHSMNKTKPSLPILHPRSQFSMHSHAVISSVAMLNSPKRGSCGSARVKDAGTPCCSVASRAQARRDSHAS
jgi:serine/threonine-protein kinase